MMTQWYGIVSDILSQNGFDWDSTKYMINVENENAWNEYVKSRDEAKQFLFKVIPNWDDIIGLCAKDRATRIEAETNYLMSKEANEEEGIHSMSVDLEESSSATKKKTCTSRSGEKEGIVASINEVASSLKVFAKVTMQKVEIKKQMVIKEAKEMVEEMHNELKNAPYLESGLRQKKNH
ncbi:hypothetical protein HKD37_01G000143 [Glycine soja]